MKAARYSSYGSPEVITIMSDLPLPTLKPGQILVDTHAANINPFDIKLRSGAYKDSIPLNFPITIGGDYSGIITAIADDVTDLQVGDQVYGTAIVLNGGSGAIAQTLAANSQSSAKKPHSISFEEAAALPLVGSSTVQALEEHINLKPDQKILIHGGAGGIGHLAIQLAKAIGAYVATTVSAKDVDFVKSLGADQVIDYNSQRFEELLSDFDAAYDTVGGQVTDRSFQVLKSGGILVSMLGQPSPELAKQFDVTAIGQNTKTNTTHLNRVAQLVDQDKLTVHLDQTFSLDQTKEAFLHQETASPNGKVVVQIN